MAQANANRQTIKPRVREEVEQQATVLEALTFTAGGATGPEAEALRDAVVAALRTVFGQP